MGPTDRKRAWRLETDSASKNEVDEKRNKKRKNMKNRKRKMNGRRGSKMMIEMTKKGNRASKY